MVPGTPSTIICAHCGWQNDSTARMCGGCGMPLHSIDPGATSQDNTGPGEWRPGPGNVGSPDTPTMMSPGGNVAAQAYAQPATPPAVPQNPTPVTASPAAAWPAAGQAKAKPATGRFRWWVIPVAILITLIVLGALGLGVWGLGIQPSTATSVQNTFPLVLDSAFSQVNTSLTPNHNGQVQISAAALDELIRAKSPSSGPVTGIDFNFITFPHAHAGFQLTYSFNFFGTEEQNTTAELSLESGQLAARSTVVNGSMSLFESGVQMEQTLNNALASLNAIQGKVESFQLQGDILQIQLAQS